MTAPLWKAVLEGPLGDWVRASGSASRMAAGRVPPGAWPLLAGAVARAVMETGRSTLVLVPHPERFMRELRPWLGGEPASYLFAEVAVSFLDRPPAFDEAVSHRLEALAALQGDACVVISSRRAVLRQTVAPSGLVMSTVELKPGGRLPLTEVVSGLVELGYSREPQVETPGQFALRGGILDVFPAAGRSPVRAEWFGDEIDSLRLFDPQNQRSIMTVPRVTVRPGRELLLGHERGAAAVARLRKDAALAALRPDVRADWEDELDRLAAGASFAGVEFFAAYLDPEQPSLLDHLPAGAAVIDIEGARQSTEARQIADETRELAVAEARDGELPTGFRPPMVPFDRLERLDSDAWPLLQLSSAELEGSHDLGWEQPEPVVRRVGALAAQVSARRTLVLASEQSERVEAFLTEAGVRRHPAEADLDLDFDLAPGLFRADIDLVAGFRSRVHGLEVLSDGELFGRIRRPVVRRGGPGKSLPKVSLEFQPGELVVHVDHGVARFQGMKLIEGEGADREYLELEYADSDRLFVPVESLDRVQKYLGGGEGEPTLHRLGGGDWARARSRAGKVVRDIADDLLKLYAAREAKPGLAFDPDTPWQLDLEEAFPFEETPDQLIAMSEIKADMEAGRPMDRLLCGDVGFGKTELALRAAFKAVQSGRQVAMLVPTTVLCQQHYLVFKERLRDYPVEVEMLSRFRSEEELEAAVRGIKAGTVDIAIGTHRLLQRDVRFKRLGLVIIDEEQRFGVVQKERLKKLRIEVDVLTLSATPIPRTLHMAVAGLRDMSVVQTPPEDRQPIKTYVTADDDDLLTQVVERELERGGQVYFVHNRVRTIQRAAERLNRLVPRARIAIGHGQMDENDLARVMVEFTERRFDVLVCTTIIESGLDIPNVNTILVQHADRFGLSQLYQLRGRVGRAGKRAYCYLLYDASRSLTEEADKRLDVMSGLHELGMGFKIALRDLEIRGAGNLLGSEQHGAIAAVGFEMYVQMLNQAVNRLRSGADDKQVDDVLTTPEMNLDLPLDHFIPRSYIRDERLRLAAYRELAAAETEDQLDGLLRSLRDRYGAPPRQLDNLAFSLRVKMRAHKLGLRSVVGDAKEIVLRVDADRPLDVDVLVRRFHGRLKVAPNKLRLQRAGEGWCDDLMDLLDAMAELYADATISSNV